MRTANYAIAPAHIGTRAPFEFSPEPPRRALSFRTVFHPADFSEGDQGAFEHALRLAVAARAQLTLLHAGPDPFSVHRSDFPRVRKTLEQWGLITPGGSPRELAKLGLSIEKVKKAGRDPVRCTLDYVADNKPDLIVLSTHQRHGLDRWLHQAIAEPIARGAHTLTLFVPRGVPGFVSPTTGCLDLRTILIPIDASPKPQPALDAAFALPGLLGCSNVHFSIFHAGSNESLVEVNTRVLPGCTVETTTWEGDVVDHIAAVSNAQEADLIVMATAGHRGFLDALRGSTTERLVREARCPVLAVPVS